MSNSARIAAGVGAAFAALVAILVLNTVGASSKQIQAQPVEIAVDSASVASRLAAAVQFPTISSQGAKSNDGAFANLMTHFETTYPRFFSELEVERVNRWTIHAVWKGSDSARKPVVFLAHTDVVPIPPGTEANWTHPPFEGVIADGYIWGRGTIDDKQNVIAYLEAAEALLTQGYKPKRTMHFVFGHDEETGGAKGAKAVADKLKKQGVALEAVYDEGLVIADGLVPGIDGRVGLIGIAEKGYLTLELSAQGAEGHSSMPPVEGTAVGKLATAITRLESRPFPSGLDGPAAMVLDFAAPEMGFGMKLVMSNRWLTGPLISRKMMAKRSTRAAMTTTMAPTMLNGSIKENVLPGNATAIVNFRIHPRDSIDSVTKWVEHSIADSSVTLRNAGDTSAEPCPAADVEGPGFEALQRSYAEVFPGMPVAPGLMVALTDSRHFQSSTKQIFRFQPVPMVTSDLGRIHGTDERIAVEDFANIVRLYTRLIQNSAD